MSQHGPFALTATGVIASGTPTFDQWNAAFRWCNGVVRASSFWIGDLLVFGEQKFGEMYRAALEFTDYTPETLRNIKYVAASVHLSRRRDALSFNHHANVAPLPPDQQAKWLERAEKERLSVMRLRELIREAMLGPPTVPDVYYKQTMQHTTLEAPYYVSSRGSTGQGSSSPPPPPDAVLRKMEADAAGLKLTLPDEVHERVDELLRNIRELREAIQFCWKP